LTIQLPLMHNNKNRLHQPLHGFVNANQLLPFIRIAKNSLFHLRDGIRQFFEMIITMIRYEINNVILRSIANFRSMKDACIRQLLKGTELRRFLDDPNSKVVDELSLPVAKARIDVAVINGFLHGYEIKSASDTLQRLPSQIEAYTKVFDYLSIVTESKYHERILDFVPPWVGLIVCNEKKDVKMIEQIRKPKLNKDKQVFFIAKLLWREELIDSLTEYQIPFRKKDRNWLLCETLSSNLDINEVSFIVRDKLKKRVDWKKMIHVTECYEAM
jgi:hypothetical protein